jgi:epoxyqueuosine reductase
VVVLTTAYRHPWPARPEGLRGRVSRYASGRDYHRVIQRRLRKLRRAIVEWRPGTHVYASVDTGPVMEKAWAQRAGLGWVGKHGNLLTRDRSSWVFLSVLALDVALPPDAPHPEHCGTCDLCIRACPTAAIVSPGVVDARGCIANHTIEHDGVVPEPLRAGHGDWVFGCDDCQDVCPWNRFADANADGDPHFAPTPERAFPDLVALLHMSTADFDAHFQGTPLARAGRPGLSRSAALALGNAGDVSAVPALVNTLAYDAHAPTRAHAAWALGRLGGDEALGGLRAQLAIEAEPSVRAEIESALRAWPAA